MSKDLDLSGPTVTLFGDLDPLGEALSDELADRGFSTHAVTTPMGWFTSVTRAVVRIGTPVGERAFLALADADMPPVHVIAVCETPHDPAAQARLDELCRRCGARHVVSLIWHPALELRMGDPGPELSPRALATIIADELAGQDALTAPTFKTRDVAAPV